jgi:hypothetical protein
MRIDDVLECVRQIRGTSTSQVAGAQTHAWMLTMSQAPDHVYQPGRVRVRFDLPGDGSGWPPASSEGLWAAPLPEPDHVQLDNVPWFARGVADGDVFRVSKDENGVLWAVEKVSWSGNCTIRVIPFRDGPLTGDMKRVLEAFEPFSVSGDGIAQYRIVALSIPPEADLVAVKRVLKEGERNGSWAFEEGCIGEAWQSAG